MNARERNDMQKLIRLLLDSPIAGNEEVRQVDGNTSLNDFKKANVDVKTRILLQMALDAMKGDRQSAEFLFKYGGFEPVKEQNITMQTPTIIDDMGTPKPAPSMDFVPPAVYDDPDESTD